MSVDLPRLGTNRAIQHGAQRKHRALQRCIECVSVSNAACKSKAETSLKDNTLANSVALQDWHHIARLACNLVPRRQQPTRTAGSQSRSVLTYGSLLVGSCCAVRDLLYRGPIRRHQQKAGEAGNLRLLQRAVHSACTTGPRFSWQDAATTRTGTRDFC
jgi:hypothetical protein